MNPMRRSPFLSRFLLTLALIITPSTVIRANQIPEDPLTCPLPCHHPTDAPSNPGEKPVVEVSPANAITIAERLSQYYFARSPMPAVLAPLGRADATMDMTDAAHIRNALVTYLTPDLGRIVGYKAGLTSPPAQARFGVNHPLRGILLEGMLLDSGATVSTDLGTRPLVEADLIVRVGSIAINHATTREEAIASLDAVVPFIELPDLLSDPDVHPTATDLVAINVGARSGVVGTPINLQPRQDGRSWIDTLGDTPVEMVNAAGETVTQGNTQALLGHPLDAVLWLVADLQAEGKWLHPGDLLSLGSITAPMPLTADQTLRLRYHHLASNGDDVEVMVIVAPSP